MVDTCVIRALINSDTLDEATGEYLRVPNPDFPDPVYTGACKFTVEAIQVRDVDSQGQDLAVADGILRIPVTAPGSALVSKDHTATILLAANDTATITAIIQAGHAQTLATARRFPVEITT
jgi:hypothetical protein